MKHGPIALLDESTPVVCVATESPVLDKVLSNVEEVRARGADTIAIATEGCERVARGRRPDDRGRPHRLDPAADRRDPAAAAARLRHRPRPRPQRRPAAQPGEDRHGRVSVHPDQAAVGRVASLPANDQNPSRPPSPAAVLAAALVFAGCGGSGSSGSDLASFAAARIARLRRRHGAAHGGAEVERRIARQERRRDRQPRRLRSSPNSKSSSREDGEPFDFAKEVEPWLGEKAAVFFERLRRRNSPNRSSSCRSTDTARDREFIDSPSQAEQGPLQGCLLRRGRLQGRRLRRHRDRRGRRIPRLRRRRKQPSRTRSTPPTANRSPTKLAIQDAISDASDGSLADVYVDVGGLIKASGGNGINPQAAGDPRKSAGVEPDEATAVASVVPGLRPGRGRPQQQPRRRQKRPAATPPALLGSLPADSFAAFAAAGFGEQLKEAIDRLDAEGIPGQVPPNQLKSTLSATGIDLDKIGGFAGRRGGVRRR